MLPKGKPWGTWLLVGVLALVIGPMIIDALPGIWEESGGSAAVGQMGNGASRTADAVLPTVVTGVAILFAVVVGIFVLVKVLPAVFGGGGGLFRGLNGGFGGGGRGGQRDLQRAQRDEFSAIARARSEGQHAVRQAQMEATRRRDAAVRAAQQMVNAEQDGWS